MQAFKGMIYFALLLTFLIMSAPSFAQSSPGNSEFGLGQPHSTNDLPPGLLRSKLESLPPQARSKAMLWLQGFSFPAADIDLLQVDESGAIFYSDTMLPNMEVDAGPENAGPTAPGDVPQSTLDNAFLLHSNPGAPNVVYLDFDGEVVTGTAWNSTHQTLDAIPFSLDADPNNFSNAERLKIVDVWHRMAEDVAGYDIDVTTERPNSFGSQTGHVVITNHQDANGNEITCASCGGTAYVGVFGGGNYTFYSPAWVYFNKLGSSEWNIAEAGSHEFGHNLGLSHDGVSGGSGYYGGHGSDSDPVSWAPIMGVGYYKNVTQWSKGEYTNANNTQDDLAIIDGKLNYRTDDHGNSRGASTPLLVDGTGAVVASNPALDPDNVLTENKGVIETSSDVDMFSFTAGAGTINLTVNPAWDAFYRASNHRGANLDIDIELQDLNGTPIDGAEPNTETNASISTNVGGGTYYLRITGVGNAISPYTDYASVGEYFINGTVPVSSPDTDAPTPNPMSWASVPTAVSESAISMTATTATDAVSSVEYNFQCTVGGSGCSSSGWQASTSHTATGLAASTSYTFHVTARDQANNQTASSPTASATTNAPPPPPADPSGFVASAVSDTAINLVWADNASDETGYRLERSVGGQNNFATIANLGVNANGYSDSGLAASTTYDYRVAAFRNAVFSAYATSSATTDDPPPPPTSVDFVANSGTSVDGSVSGSYTNTHSDNGSSQSITERSSGGKKSNRYSFLEYRWNFNITLGASVSVYANAWSSVSADGDTFDFEYSLNNGSSFQPMFNVSSTSAGNLESFTLPGTPSGSIIIRVVDTDQTAGNQNLDEVFVDHLFIQVGNPSTEPPDGDPSAMSANAISSSRIDLAWTNGSSNEAGLKVERSADGNAPWTEVADLAAGSSSYSDLGLTAVTQYFYRVSAYNSNGVSAYAFADATTLVAPALALSTSGYKSKGKKHIVLTWTGSTNVDVYRDGNPTPVATSVSGNNYDDNTNEKGGGSYTHQVCEAGTSTCSNIATTVF